jgi:hypothetical protein
MFAELVQQGEARLHVFATVARIALAAATTSTPATPVTGP